MSYMMPILLCRIPLKMVVRQTQGMFGLSVTGLMHQKVLKAAVDLTALQLTPKKPLSALRFRALG